MQTDAPANDAPHDDDIIGQATQEDDAEQTQAVEQPSQVPKDANLWGVLIPCNQNLLPIKFDRRKPLYKIGRNDTLNDVLFPGFKVSNEHAEIRWDGIDGDQSCVVVRDKSSNGTFINSVKIGKGQSSVLYEGNEIAFGNVSPQAPESMEDYRFIFRSLTNSTPKTGLHAEYDLVRELGKGAFATVMRAVERETGLFVAVKMIHAKNLGREEADQRETQLDREIAIIASLKHPNICGFKKMFKQPDGGRNLVIELVEGGDLLDYILARQGLGEDIAQHFTYQMCDALAFCHSKNIAHRDLKPENILLTLHNPPQVKIADFGLAKVADSATMLRTMCGTPSYLAPEVVTQNGITGYGNVVDAWSIGVIVFCMLTNSSPFDDSAGPADIRERIRTRQICWSVLRERNLTVNAENFIYRFLKTNPAERMTCEVALVHPWLMSYNVIYDHSDFPDYQPPSARCNREVVPRDLSMMTADSFSDIDASGSQGANVSAPIQRRSQIMHSRIDDNKEVPDVGLSPDLIANFERLTNQSANEEVAPVNVNGNGKRSLTPMPEDPVAETNDVSMDIASPRKKARPSDESMSDVPATPPTRGRGKGARGGRGKKGLMDNVVPRRSARNARTTGR
ncbi:Pkinase-domain-containing protein [Hymenopellis radicata]|nr:Pkinase-domain-containing protein [Hymenopellis radicata]